MSEWERTVTDDAPHGAPIPEPIEERLNALRIGALQDRTLTQGEVRDLATELLSMLSAATPSEEQTGA